MTEHTHQLPGNRKPTPEELRIVQWLLENSTSDTAASYMTQVSTLQVVSRCDCGCASINFSAPTGSSMDVLSDYQWTTHEGHLCGVFIFARDNRLAGLEVWSIDGLSSADNLPNPTDLKSIS